MPEATVHKDGYTLTWKHNVGADLDAAGIDSVVLTEAIASTVQSGAQHDLRLGVGTTDCLHVATTAWTDRWRVSAGGVRFSATCLGIFLRRHALHHRCTATAACETVSTPSYSSNICSNCVEYDHAPRPQGAVVSGLSVLEICAGAGGQSVGLEQAGFEHAAAVEIDQDACETLRLNRPEWDVLQVDVREVDGGKYDGIDLLAGGVPCPPFSIAGKRLGADDERDLFPQAVRLVAEANPRAVMLENVKGLASAKFKDYLEELKAQFEALKYECDWQVLNSSEFGVPQLRPRFIFVALHADDMERFSWPGAQKTPPSVGKVLKPLMAAAGWEKADEWAKGANAIAPTLVGGSRKHGGPDLGPTRAREDWKKLGVDGRSLADQPPQPGDPLENPMPRLTLKMAARVQGFPTDWQFSGRKTASYRQIGNAFPPPVAEAVGRQIREAIAGSTAVGKPELRAVV